MDEQTMTLEMSINKESILTVAVYASSEDAYTIEKELFNDQFSFVFSTKDEKYKYH